MNPFESLLAAETIPSWSLGKTLCIYSALALVATVLPLVLALLILESPRLRRTEPAESVSTPNPTKSPLVSKRQELLVYLSPRFASFLGSWFYVYAGVAILWIAIAPQLWARANPCHRSHIFKLVLLSVLLGTVMALPWLLAVCIFFRGIA